MLVCVAATSTWYPAEETTELGAKVRVMPVSLSTCTLLVTGCTNRLQGGGRGARALEAAGGSGGYPKMEQNPQKLRANPLAVELDILT